MMEIMRPVITEVFPFSRMMLHTRRHSEFSGLCQSGDLSGVEV